MKRNCRTLDLNKNGQSKERRREYGGEKKLLLAGIAIGLVFLGACADSNHLGEQSLYGEEVNKLEGVKIELTEDSYQPSGDEFELHVMNNSDNEITYGVAYELEYYEDGNWFEVIPQEEMAFIAIALILEPGEEDTEEINMEFYEPLETGHYRLVRLVENEPLTAELDIVEE